MRENPREFYFPFFRKKGQETASAEEEEYASAYLFLSSVRDFLYSISVKIIIRYRIMMTVKETLISVTRTSNDVNDKIPYGRSNYFFSLYFPSKSYFEREVCVGSAHNAHTTL